MGHDLPHYFGRGRGRGRGRGHDPGQSRARREFSRDTRDFSRDTRDFSRFRRKGTELLAFLACRPSDVGPSL